MERNIVKDVTRLSREHKDTIVSQSGIESSLDENQIAQYIEKVFQEMKKKKTVGQYAVIPHKLPQSVVENITLECDSRQHHKISPYNYSSYRNPHILHWS